MDIYAVSNPDKRLSFYLKNGQTNIPENAFQVSYEEWLECIEFPEKYIENNKTLKLNPSFIPSVVVEPLPAIDKKAVVIANLQASTTIAQLKSALISYFS